MRFSTAIRLTAVQLSDGRTDGRILPQGGNRPSAQPSEPVSPTARLRDRYTFLDEPDCPVELHALVGHRVSMYHEYSKLYPQLRDAVSLTELSTVCGKLLDAYLDNQSCTRELEYYQKHRKILGHHPYFRQFQELSRLRSKTTKQLFEEKKRTLDNIWRAESEIRKGTKPHLDAERRRRIEQYRLKLQEINCLLGDE